MYRLAERAATAAAHAGYLAQHERLLRSLRGESVHETSGGHDYPDRHGIDARQVSGPLPVPIASLSNHTAAGATTAGEKQNQRELGI